MDAARHVTYDPVQRPAVANLLPLCALCTGERPEDSAAGIRDKGSVELKRRLADAMNQYFRDIRLSRAECVADEAFVWKVLRAANERAKHIAAATMDDLRSALGMEYDRKAEYCASLE